ncbi:MAG: glycosyltransferase family 2 protein [Phycisphaerales bacterium]|nr:glycosyltransferase family 2 protein [Phycisphaerales bacterium]
MRTLVAIPVYNEAKHVESVLGRVLARHADVLVVDDGSTDATAELVSRHPVDVIRRRVNRGYGASMREAFRFAAREHYDWLITMDCDDQHEPDAIPEFIEAAREDDADVVSGSRYLAVSKGNDRPPPERRAINVEMTREINCRLGRCLGTLLTDAFCGFKAYRVDGLRRLRPTVRGYAFPMQFWVQAAWAGLRVREMPVRLIYNDPNRSFGATLDDPARRLRHYRSVLHRELLRRAPGLPCASLMGIAGRGRDCGCQ